MTQQPKMPGEIWAAKLETRGQIWCEYDPSPCEGIKYIRADIVEGMVEALRYYQKNARSWISGSETSHATAALLAYEEGRK